MIRHLHTAAVLLVAAVAVSACGKEEEALLDRAFKQEIRSATVSMRIEAGAGAITLSGPVKDNGKGKLPSFDWRVRGEGAAGRALDARIVSSGRNVFVTYEGDTYEVGERRVAQMERESRKGDDQQIEDVEDARRLGLRLQDWFPQSDVEEDSRVGDEATTRVSGKLDVSAALKDLRRLAQNPALADPSLQQLGTLSPEEIARVDKLVSDPRFAVDVAESDGKLRRIAATMTVREQPGGRAQPLRFTFTLSDVDEAVEIDAPERGKPIRELLRRLQAESDPEGVTQS